MYILLVFGAVILLIAIVGFLKIFFKSKQTGDLLDFQIPEPYSPKVPKSAEKAVIISCYFNPQRNPYRLKAFNIFYDKIKHLNHRIIECVIDDAQPELPTSANITRVYAKNLLWHKEALLNKIIADLPKQFEYIFWVDADVIFENDQWLTKGIEELQTYKIIQPFEYCVHLERDQTRFQGDSAEINKRTKERIVAGERVENIRVWQSFCATYRETYGKNMTHYDLHGHVGFAWGARREVLEKVPLYDRALIGGADHIIAHAAVGQIPHECITKAFAENIDEINEWSKRFYEAVSVYNKVSFVRGNLLHIWHGDLKKRDYLNRIKANTPKIKEIRRKDQNGLYETDDDLFVRQYFQSREVGEDEIDDFDTYDYSSSTDYNDSKSETDYTNRTYGFDGGGAGGAWESSSSASEGISASASMDFTVEEGSVSASLESSSTFS